MGLTDEIFIIAAAMIHRTMAQEAEMTDFNYKETWKTRIFVLEAAGQQNSERAPAAEMVQTVDTFIQAGLPPVADIV